MQLRTARQKRRICIPMDICKYSSTKVKRCCQSAKYSCSNNQKSKSSVFKMSTYKSPEKFYAAKTSTIISTSTQTANMNLNVVLNHGLNPIPSLSRDSDTEVIPPPQKLQLKSSASKKIITIISLPHQFPGISCPL